MAPHLYVAAVLLALAGLHFSEAAINVCRNVPGFELPEDNSYVTYDYTVDGTNACTGVTRKCSGSIPSLIQRSWFINPVKSQFGTHYRDRSLEIYRIQCPPEARILHLFTQELDVEIVTGAARCTDNDFVTVDYGQSSTQAFCGSNIRVNELYNFGRGVLVEEGNATVTFCTDGENNENGFVIRATCIDPMRTDVAGCASFPFFFEWDRDFVDISARTFQEPEQTVATRIHKRSANKPLKPSYQSLMKRLQLFNLHSQLEPETRKTREKRFVNFVLLFLMAGQSASYVNNTLTVDFNNGNTRVFTNIAEVDANNNLIGTRRYQETSGGRVFNGPASIQVDKQKAIIREMGTISINTLLLTPLASSIVNRIADYIWDNYLEPYPIVDESGFNLGSLPLLGEDDLGNFVRFTDIPLVRESINANSTCRRVVNQEISPARGSVIDEDLVKWCDFFFYACNPYLAAMCDQVNKLNTIPRL